MVVILLFNVPIHQWVCDCGFSSWPPGSNLPEGMYFTIISRGHYKQAEMCSPFMGHSALCKWTAYNSFNLACGRFTFNWKKCPNPNWECPTKLKYLSLWRICVVKNGCWIFKSQMIIIRLLPCLNTISLINHVSFIIDKEARKIELFLKPTWPVSSFFYQLNKLPIHNSCSNIQAEYVSQILLRNLSTI